MKKLLVLALVLLSACKNLETTIDQIAPPSKTSKGDGYIFFDYIAYEQRYNFNDKDGTRLVLKTRKQDVQKVKIVMDGKDYEMHSIGEMGEFEYFEGKVTKIKEGKFHFVISDGNLAYYLGEKGSLNSREIEPLELAIGEKSENNGDSKLWYRIYIDSFYNGNKENDPVFNEYGPESFLKPEDTNKAQLVEDWGNNIPKKILGKFQLNSWIGDFNENYFWENKAKNIYGESYVGTKRFGGDLQGVEAKIDYFKAFSINTVWISSPFYSFSGSKNDVIDFRHISPDYGMLVEKSGESQYKLLNLNSSEKNSFGESLSVETWKNTSSDEYFREFLGKLDKENIKVISDLSFDYVSSRIFAFEDVLRNGKDSIYWNWFFIEENSEDKIFNGSSDKGVESKEGLRYRKSFVKVLPEYTAEEKQEILEWNKANMTYKSVGANKELINLNLDNKEVQDYIYNSAKKWLDMGLEGYMFRVKEKANESFYKELELKLNADNKYTFRYDLIDSQDTTLDKEKTLNYELVDSFQKFFGTTTFGGEDLFTSLYIQNRNKKSINFIENIDIDRLNSSFINGSREFDTNNEEIDTYLGIKPDILDASTLAKYKMATLLQFVLSGNQSIYYGSERFMWGGDVPHNRKPMIWEELMPYEDESDIISKYSSQKTVLDTKVVYDEVENKIRYKSLLDKSMSEHYKNIIKIRNEYKELIKYGQMEKMSANANILVFSKSYNNEIIIFAINKSSKEEKVILEIGRGKELVNIADGSKKDILDRKSEISIPAYGYIIYRKVSK